MNYELVRELRDAGFSQIQIRGGKWMNKIGEIVCADSEIERMLPPPKDLEWVYVPELSELIEACGADFRDVCRNEYGNGKVYWLINRNDMWNTKYPIGSTPEEAVANLWLSLNKK